MACDCFLSVRNFLYDSLERTLWLITLLISRLEAETLQGRHSVHDINTGYSSSGQPISKSISVKGMGVEARTPVNLWKYIIKCIGHNSIQGSMLRRCYKINMQSCGMIVLIWLPCVENGVS